MKASLKFLLILISAAFLSCGDDENTPAVSLEGKWKVTSLEYFDCTGSTANSLRECGTFSFCATWEFKSDGTSTIFYEGGGTSVSTYTVYPGGTVGLCTSACSNLAYAISGNQLSITSLEAGSNDCRYTYTYQKVQ